MQLQLTGYSDFMERSLNVLRLDTSLGYIDAYEKLCSFDNIRLSPWSYTLSSSGIVTEVREWDIKCKKYEVIYNKIEGLLMILYNYDSFTAFDKQNISIILDNYSSISIYDTILNLKLLGCEKYSAIDLDKESSIFASIITDSIFVIAFNKEIIEKYIQNAKIIYRSKEECNNDK